MAHFSSSTNICLAALHFLALLQRLFPWFITVYHLWLTDNVLRAVPKRKTQRHTLDHTLERRNRLTQSRHVRQKPLTMVFRLQLTQHSESLHMQLVLGRPLQPLYWKRSYFEPVQRGEIFSFYSALNGREKIDYETNMICKTQHNPCLLGLWPWGWAFPWAHLSGFLQR